MSQPPPPRFVAAWQKWKETAKWEQKFQQLILRDSSTSSRNLHVFHLSSRRVFRVKRVACVAGGGQDGRFRVLEAEPAHEPRDTSGRQQDGFGPATTSC